MEETEKKRLRTIRAAISGETKLAVEYRDRMGRKSARILWPFFLKTRAFSLHGSRNVGRSVISVWIGSSR
jgi:predicted DNA-binding transcriptional regulator YafY